MATAVQADRRGRSLLSRLSVTFLATSGLVAGMGLLFLAGLTFGYRKIRPVRPVAVFTIDRRELDFGTVQAQPRFEWKVRLRNTSEYAVYVEDVRVSCNCASVTPTNFLVPRGGNQALTFVIDTTRRGQTPEVRGSRAVAIRFLPVISRAAPFTDMINLRGRVIDPITSEPEFILYGGAQALVEGQPGPTRKVTIHIRGDFPPDSTMTAACNPRIGTVTTPRPLSNGDWQFIFTPTIMGEVATFSDEIDLRLVHNDGSEHFRTSVVVAGHVVSAIDAQPAHVVIPSREEGTLLAGECAISLRTGELLSEAPRLRCQHPSLRAQVALEDFPSPRATIRLSGIASTRDPQSADIEVIVSALSGQHYNYIIPMSWHVAATKAVEALP